MYRTGQVILELYRASREVPFRCFQEHALAIAKRVIAFDSAWWGTASISPNLIHRLHLHNCDGGFPYLEQNFVRQAMLQNPGTTINLSDLITHDAFVRTELYRLVGEPHKIECLLATLLIEPASSLIEFITLWRHDSLRPFNENERMMKEVLMPHLAEAHRNARLQHVLKDKLVHHVAWAVVDQHAYLLEISTAFVSKIKDEWPSWKCSRLPEPLLRCIPQIRSFRGRKLIVDITPHEEFYILEARSLSAFDRLAPRERNVAERYSQGQTYGEIAADLGLSPITVRNQIARCFKKLGVNNKSELIHRIDQSFHR